MKFKDIDEKILSSTECIRAYGPYCFFMPGDKMLTCTLKYFSNMLEKEGWLRIHSSFLINPKFIDHDRCSTGYVVLLSGDIYEIARRRKSKIHAALKELKFLKIPKLNEVTPYTNYTASY